MRANFWNKGYTTVAQILTEDEVDIVLRAIRATHPRHWLRLLNCQNRPQMSVDMTNDTSTAPSAFQLVLERFIAYAARIHPASSVSKRLTVLESQPHAKAEHLHRVCGRYNQNRMGTGLVSTCVGVQYSDDHGAAGFRG